MSLLYRAATLATAALPGQSDSVGEQITTVLVWATIILVAFSILVAILKAFLNICKPNEIIVVEGRSSVMPDGTKTGYHIATAGRVFRWPILEQIKHMDTSIIPIEVNVRGAYSKGGIPLNISAIANVKISNEPAVVRNAVERFLDKDKNEIMHVIRENLEGNLRQVVATLTPEELNEDRLKFAETLQDEADDDLLKLGVQLDTLSIQNVSDNSNYLDNIGRMALAEVLKNAQNAESRNREEAERRVKEVTGQAEAEQERIDGEISARQNQLRSLKAELELQASTEEENAQAAAREAKAISEQELQTIRAQLEALRLQADVQIPAETKKRAAELKAKGDAAFIEENGKVVAKVLALNTEVWKQAGKDARDIYLIQHIEEILESVVSAVNNIQVQDVALVDNGDGQSLPAYVASFPATVNRVLEEMKTTTGINIAAIMKGE